MAARLSPRASQPARRSSRRASTGCSRGRWWPPRIRLASRCRRRSTDVNGGFSGIFIRYPIATSLIMVGILFVGLVAYSLRGVAPLPQVDFPTIQVTAQLPGASPETMASSVAQPLERQFAQIPGIAQMTSTSYLGTAAVTIQFDLNR